MGEVSDLITVPVEVSDEELEAAAQKAEEALEKGERAEEQAERAKEVTDQVVEQESHVTGTYYLARRVSTLMPEIRSAYFLLSQIRLLLRVSPEIAALLLAIQVIHLLIDMREEQERQAKEYEEMVRQYRRLSTHAEYLLWQEEDERKRRESYRSQPV